MNTYRCAFAILCCVPSLTLSSSAEVIFSDDFTGANRSSVVAQSDWSGSEDISYFQNAARLGSGKGTDEISASFEEALTGDDVMIKFDVLISSYGVRGGSNSDYFFRTASSSDGQGSWNNRIALVNDDSGKGERCLVKLRLDSSFQESPFQLQSNTKYTFQLTIAGNGSESTLRVFESSKLVGSITSSQGSVSGIESIVLRQTDSLNGVIDIDNLTVTIGAESEDK